MTNPLREHITTDKDGRIYHWHECDECGGSGGFANRLYDGSYDTACERCGGDGEWPDEDCTCPGCMRELERLEEEDMRHAS